MSNRTPQSIVQYFPSDSGNRCGYCNNSDTSLSNGMWAHQLSVQDYQDLIDRGWRRSGKYTYKPTMDRTCCPQYTIKCAASDFKLNRSHKKAIKRFNRYINVDAGEKEKGSTLRNSEEFGDICDVPAERMVGPSQEEGLGEIDTSRLQGPMSGECAQQARVSSSGSSSSPSSTLMSSSNESSLEKLATGRVDDTQDNQTEKEKLKKRAPRPGTGADPNRPVCQKAKDRRRARWQQKQAEGGEPRAKTSKPTDTAKCLELLLNEITSDPKHKFEVRLVRSSPRSAQFSNSFEESYDVYKKYQMAIHGDPPDKPTRRQYTNFLIESPLQVRLVRSSPRSDAFNASLDESYSVYQRYQMNIHNDGPDDCDRSSFLSFLVISPLQPYHTEGGFPDGYGSFHQQYLIDGRIVAVGVIDILPTCVSSVYLYYDPDYSFLSIGTYSALQELAFTRRLRTMEPSIHYYYMGFYIHGCPKMRYKGQYAPSFILCPETYNWIPIETCRPKLDANKYARLEDSIDAVDAGGHVDLGKVLILWQHQAIRFQFYTFVCQDNEDEEEVREYAHLVGRTCAERMLLVRTDGS